MFSGLDREEMIKRGFKYLIQWLAIVVAALFIPNKPLDQREVFMIAVIGAATFALLDLYAPTVSNKVNPELGLAIKKEKL